MTDGTIKKGELLKWDAPVPTNGPDAKRKTQGVSTNFDQMNREVLNQIFSPIEFTEDGISYSQSVSASAGTKSDVLKLKTQLENLIHVRRARTIGLCNIRHDLYSQCFDEIIRQVTIDCNPRGRLLVKVRDHYRMTIDAYRSLYENTLEWGNRKNVQVNLGLDNLKKFNVQLKEKRRDLELEANNLQISLDNLEKKLAEAKSIREKDHADELAFLKRQGQMLKAQIDQILAIK